MKHDFSPKAKNNLLNMIDEINREQVSGIIDWLGDRFYDFQVIIGQLNIKKYANNLDAYHKKMLDKNNTTKKQLNRIFADVESVDRQFATRFDSLYGMIDCYDKIIQQCAKTMKPTAGTYSIEEFRKGVGLLAFMSKINIQKIKKELERLLTIQKLEDIKFTSDSFRDISDNVKNDCIKVFEKEHPDIKNELNKVLSDPDLTDAQRRDIKFTIYCAPEPYRTIYLEHIKRYKVDVADYFYINGEKKTVSYYWSVDGKIHLIDSDEKFQDHVMSPYNTYFHESGHAIDDYEGSGYLSNSFTYEGKSLHQWIVDDTRNYVDSTLRKRYPNLTEEDYKKIMRSLNLEDGASYSPNGNTQDLPGYLKQARKDLVSYMNDTDLKGYDNASTSDVYGGVTNNAINAGFGHYGEDYWYRGENSTGMQEKELWAEFFAANMTHDEKELASLRRHFPNAYKAMEEMAKQMAGSTSNGGGVR